MSENNGNSQARAIVKAKDDKLSSSPDFDAIRKMSAKELHTEIVQTYCALGENVIIYQALVLEARERMYRGEEVGGFSTWTEYANEYLRRNGESLPTCLRRLARLIEGVNPDKKHDSSRSRKRKSLQGTPETPAAKPTLGAWRENKFHPGGKFRLRYFEEAASNFWDRHEHAFLSVPFRKALEKVGDPQHADDLRTFAAVLRAAAEKARMLADATEPDISTPETKPQPTAPESNDVATSQRKSELKTHAVHDSGHKLCRPSESCPTAQLPTKGTLPTCDSCRESVEWFAELREDERKKKSVTPAQPVCKECGEPAVWKWVRPVYDDRYEIVGGEFMGYYCDDCGWDNEAETFRREDLIELNSSERAATAAAQANEVEPPRPAALRTKSKRSNWIGESAKYQKQHPEQFAPILDPEAEAAREGVEPTAVDPEFMRQLEEVHGALIPVDPKTCKHTETHFERKMRRDGTALGRLKKVCSLCAKSLA